MAKRPALPVELRSQQETVFCIFMLLLAFVFRHQPGIVYPQLFYVFAALLGFNFLFNRFLKQRHAEAWISCAATAANGLLITGAIRYSGGVESYLWVMYLLPIFSACLLLSRRGVWLTTLFVLALHLGDQWAEFRGSDAGRLQALARAGLLFLSASFTSRLAQAEKKSKLAAQYEREKLQRALEKLSRLDGPDEEAGRLIHDMNSFITVILGSAQIMLSEYKMTASMLQDVKRVEAASKSLKGIGEKLRSAMKTHAAREEGLTHAG